MPNNSHIWLLFEVIFLIITSATAAVVTCGYNYQVVVTCRHATEIDPFSFGYNIKIYHDRYPWTMPAFCLLISTYISMHLLHTAMPTGSIATALLPAIWLNLSAFVIGYSIGGTIHNHREKKITKEALYILYNFDSGWQERAANADIIVFDTHSPEHQAYLNTPPRRRKYTYPVYAYPSAHTGK